MRRRVEAGHTWERSTEWNAVRALLAHEAQTEMGRELAATAEPLTAPRAVVAELELTRQARLALATSSPLPLDGFPDIRPVLERCRVAGSVLDGADLARLAPALLATPRLAAYAKLVRTVAPGGCDHRLPTPLPRARRSTRPVARRGRRGHGRREPPAPSPAPRDPRAAAAAHRRARARLPGSGGRAALRRAVRHDPPRALRPPPEGGGAESRAWHRARPFAERPDPLRRARAHRRRQQRPRPGGARRRARDRSSSGRTDRRGPRADRRSRETGRYRRPPRLDLRPRGGRGSDGGD